jgi:hypothetical protein
MILATGKRRVATAVNTLLLVHFDGNFADAVGATTLAASSGAAIDTSNVIFGTGSLSTGASGKVDANTADSAKFLFTAGKPFTYELFLKATASMSGATAGLICAWTLNSAFAVWFNSGSFGIRFNNGATDVQAAYNPPVGTAVHLAVCRDSSNNVSVYAAGNRIASGTFSANMLTNASLQIGYVGGFGLQASNARIDEVRISKIARYSGATITPPSGPFVLD